MPDPVSPVAVEFARQVAPRVVAELESRREAIIADSGGFPTRMAVRLAFPVALREVPHLAEAGADAMLDRFGTMNINDIAATFFQHNQAKGRPSHPTVAAAAGAFHP